MRDALDDTASAKVLISSQQPYMVQMVNDQFYAMFGFTQMQVIGRSLRSIHGPRTDAALYHQMIHTACTGRASRGTLSVCSSACSEFIVDITVIPVVEAQNDSIANLVVLLDWPTTEASAICSASPQPLCSDTTEFTYRVYRSSPAQYPTSEAVSVAPFCACPAETEPFPSFPQHQHSESVPPVCPADAPQPPRCSTILRRRRPGEADADDVGPVRPVTVTLELLEGMADLTLVAAAAALRVSTTSLKKACRKLGVDRWPYRKDRPTQAAGQNAAPPRDFDEAYVRKLHRKYGAAPRRAAPGKPG
eukprot:CAMPEP_0172188440 /NCGR_PEP_ID=MMETSP1050-20130122/21931_1 /TAXON_ID=233186 /ORGANISM="Cryptomonas curvata, Strain CCAP979/52" /LENGTH=304 /DNA_ID=CAMNT_0012862947 /DNA_START=398 /DNA_END=1308 /DNA_ORIENTATION=-